MPWEPVEHAHHEQGQLAMGLHAQKRGHPDEESYLPPLIQHGCDPGVGLLFLEERRGTGEGPEEVCQDGLQGLKHMTCVQRQRDLCSFSLVPWGAQGTVAIACDCLKSGFRDD